MLVFFGCNKEFVNYRTALSLNNLDKISRNFAFAKHRERDMPIDGRHPTREFQWRDPVVTGGTTPDSATLSRVREVPMLSATSPFHGLRCATG